MQGALARRLRDPIFWRDVTQLTKTVVAAVVAWVLAASVLDLPQPFLAPWAALLVVHATVYRTYSQGLRQVAAAVVAVLLAAAVGNAFGLDTVGVAVLLAVGLVLGSVTWFGTEATTIASTGLVVLTTGFTDDLQLLLRLIDTGIGVGVGLLVNIAVWPPLLRRTAIFSVNRIDDRIGELLVDIAAALQEPTEGDVEEWVERTRDIDGDIDEAWALVRQARESALMNPRRSAGEYRDPRLWHDLLHRMEQAVAETRSMARTLGGPANPRESWEPQFADAWTRLLGASGHAIAEADADQMHAVRHGLEELVQELTDEGPASSRWPVHGALVINLRNILDAMDEVALASPLDEPPRPLARVRWRGPTGHVHPTMRRDP